MFPEFLSKIMAATTLSLPIIMFNVHSAFAEIYRDFKVVNNTNTPLEALYVTASSAADWGGNILDKKIAAGESAELRYTGNVSSCLFDVKGIFSDGVETDERQVDFCKVGTYRFRDEQPSK